MAGVRKRFESDLEQQKSLAWHTAMLPYLKKAIPHDKFVSGKKRGANQQQLLMRARALHETFGGKK